MTDAEQQRLTEAREGVPWRRWGPYLSERQWGTVREDYSSDGNAWEYLSHDQARSRAYRWGEDGLAGFSDDRQRLCFALTLWNGRDPILKERAFGLTNREGNHGEDVKEYYHYLDATPTHAYMRYLYRYPQAAYPYADLVATNAARGRHELEYELIDTGVFDDDRYFDVIVEYAKESPDTIAIRITAHDRGPDDASIHLLPTLWFRNTWSWGEPVVRPRLRRTEVLGRPAIRADEDLLGTRFLVCDGSPALLFTENDTNLYRLGGAPNRTPHVKDAFHELLVHGAANAVNPEQVGTKAAAWYQLAIPTGGASVVRMLLTDTPEGADPSHVDQIIELRRTEADGFYRSVLPPTLDADAALVARQALAGMLWSKQFYLYDVDRWLEEHGAPTFGQSSAPSPRNRHWHHMENADVISMPDKWEYPWYAAWDLAFHVLAIGMVDGDLAKQQLELVLRDDYLHPSGQLPAYEWDFGDVNPPVHAWAAIFTYRLEQARSGAGDVDWLERVFHRLLLNFTWWVNRKDRTGSNLFEGGFLGMDNIGVFDRSAPLPTGGYLEQADGTAWMALFCQNMLEIAAELALARPVYAEMARKFVEHFLWIATSMMHAGGDTGMWDEEDGFFYDVLRTPDGGARRLKVRSMVGLLPLAAATVFDGELLRQQPELAQRMRRFLEVRPEVQTFIHDPAKQGVQGRRLASILDETKLRRVLARMLDESEFLSPFGIRSVSRHHLDRPYELEVEGRTYRVAYTPAESEDGMFGGNSNWRGPIWMPVNLLLIRALLQYHGYYGDGFRIECPTGSGRMLDLYQVAEEIGRRLSTIFLKDAQGRRPVFGGARRFQEDPGWRDTLLFYEYFHGDNGAGLGASHQTGWTGAIARVLHLFATLSSDQLADATKEDAFKAMATGDVSGRAGGPV
jgi:hypothetical protein